MVSFKDFPAAFLRLYIVQLHLFHGLNCWQVIHIDTVNGFTSIILALKNGSLLLRIFLLKQTGEDDVIGVEPKELPARKQQ